MKACPVFLKDERFVALKEFYADKHYDEYFLAEALQACRDFYGLDDEWFAATPSQKARLTRFINYNLIKYKTDQTSSTLREDSLVNLYSTMYDVYTPEQLSNRVNMLAHDFAELVTRRMSEQNVIRSRASFIEGQGDDKANGYMVLMNEVFKIYESQYTNVGVQMAKFDKSYPNATPEQRERAKQAAEYRASEYKKILQHKERLAALAAPKIGQEEGFVVTIENFEVSFKEFNEEDFNAEQSEPGKDEQGEDKEESVKGERFVDFRTVKLMESLSPRAKKLVNSIPRVNNDGKILRDDLGREISVGAAQAAVTLNRVLATSDSETFMNDLLSASEQYPWIKGLHDYLLKHPDEQATVFCNFKKAETMYYYTAFENGRLVPHLANTRSAGYALAREAGMNLSSGYVLDTEHSIYLDYGVVSETRLNKVKEAFTTIKKIATDGELRKINMAGDNVDSDAMAAFVDAHPEFITGITNHLRGLGFAVSENDIRTIANQTMTERNYRMLIGNFNAKPGKEANKLWQLMDAIDNVYKSADRALRSGNKTGLYLFDTAKATFHKINRCLALARYMEVEGRVVQGDKSLSAYNQVNLLHQIIDELANKRGMDDAAYKQKLEEDFLRYEGMSIGKGEKRRLVGWQKYLYDNWFDHGTIRDKFGVVNNTAFRGKEYGELDKVTKEANNLITYFHAKRLFGGEVGAYEVPIQGDYDTSYDFVYAPKLPTNKRYTVNEKGERIAVDCEFRDSELVSALVDEVLAEVERISAIEQRSSEYLIDADGNKVENPDYDPDRAQPSVYEEQGMRFQIFPEFNDNDFRKNYASSENDTAALEFVRNSVVEQLEKILKQERANYEKNGVLKQWGLLLSSREIEDGASFYSKDGLISDLSESAQKELDDYFLNVFFARLEITKLIDGGLHNFNGIIDFEKRNMLSHATHSPVYTKATWAGEQIFKRDYQTVVYVNDDKTKSVAYDTIDKMMKSMIKSPSNPNGIISEEQYKTWMKAYEEITSTDGQGLRNIHSYRALLIGTNQWNDRLESAYRNIIDGHPRKPDLDLFLQPIKPVTTGFEILDPSPGSFQKPIKLTVLHKYSELCLLPVALAKYCPHAMATPIQGIAQATEDLFGTEDEVDLWLFSSGAKVGGFSAIDPFQKGEWMETEDGRQIFKKKAQKDGGVRMNTDKQQITDYIVANLALDRHAIHKIPWIYTGIAASTPAHAANTKISRAEQMEKQAWSNIREGDMVQVAGTEEPMSAIKARDTYYAIKTANIIDAYKRVSDFFQTKDALARALKEELADKAYTSSELPYALSVLESGEFALPLFSPNTNHQVQQLLASIIKKRISKPKTKGVNMLVSTALGMENDLSQFSENGGLPDSWKLGVKFESKNGDTRMKYMEVGLPLFDDRLKEFADENGNIGPERLDKLIKDGIIDERLLYFNASRTPSDAEHSIIPCRVKWFSNNIAGARMVVPREGMVITGQDFDGDKLRCDFMDFDVVWDEELMQKDYDKLARDWDSEKDGKIGSFNQYKKALKERNPERYRKISVPKYDYTKSPLEQSQKARDNAMVELMFAQLTSFAGSKRVLIPGGCDETKVFAKAHHLVRLAKDPTIRMQIAEQLGSKEINKDPRSADNAVTLYNTLVSLEDWQLTRIMRRVSGYTTPYTVSHSMDAFEYIMGGAEMIGIYARASSTHAMLQRANIHYIPFVGRDKNGKSFSVDLKLFGHTVDKMFDVTNGNGMIASLGLARLVNAAVDNNKDPVLGYLYQTKEMANVTSFLLGAGIEEQDVHLLLNQPAVIELINRLKGTNGNKIGAIIDGLIDEMKAAFTLHKDVGMYGSVKAVGDLSRKDYIANLGYSYEDIMNGGERTADLAKQQIQILFTLKHIAPQARNLNEFIGLVRPSSDGKGNAMTITGLTTKMAKLSKFRDDVASGEVRFSGMDEILDVVDAGPGVSSDYILKQLGDVLPEVRALNALMVEGTRDMYIPYFPQARNSWINVATGILGGYHSFEKQETILNRIMNEMVLWKLLQNKKFVRGDSQEEQKRILVDVPKNLKDLQQRIAAEEKLRDEGKPVVDKAARALVGNQFLGKLSSTLPTSASNPRLRFEMNGQAIEGESDAIRAGWNQMLRVGDAGIYKLAIDLFKYNLYTNGFTYGAYEFSHFAPFSVLMATPGYKNALLKILKSDFKDDRDIENFVNQYYMNHWGDKDFLYTVNRELLPEGVRDENGNLTIELYPDNEVFERIDGKPYIVAYVNTTDENGKPNQIQTLLRVNNEGNRIVLREAEKLGVRLNNNQLTLQYNPAVDYDKIKPVVPGNDSAWGWLDAVEEAAYAESDISDAPDMGTSDAGYLDSFNVLWRRGPKKVKGAGVADMSAAAVGSQLFKRKTGETLAQLHDDAEKNVKVNGDVSSAVPDMGTPAPGQEWLSNDGNNGPDPTAFRGLFGSKKMFQISHIDENGKVRTEKVPITPESVREARKQQVLVELNRKLREILREKGVAVGVLNDAEARLWLNGVSDFDTAVVTAEGLKELIRLAEGYRGEMALPEEFAHVALAMLGENPLATRLYNAINSSDAALKEAFEGEYDEYMRLYEGNRDKMVVEAAGKLVAKHLLYEQEIQTNVVKRLVARVSDAIKAFFRRFSKDEIQNAIFDADRIASKVAREMLGGRLLDDGSMENIRETGEFYNASKDLSGKQDVLSKLLKNEVKKLGLYKARLQALGRDANNSPAVQHVQNEIASLENGIKNHKVEESIVSYCANSSEFLAKTFESLQDTINSGRGLNAICKKLNIVRDTLYSFSSSLDAINDALVDKEIFDTVGLRESLKTLEDLVNRINREYNNLGRRYFEEMLANVYGEHGVTVNIGKDKGRNISIHEMATKADRDISLMSRWFYSLADCNDYVLRAIDDITRNAKMVARRRTESIRPRIEVAVADLVRSTGSRDQSFMFEMERGDDGKMHKTGKYIAKSSKAYEKLSGGQKKFYDTMMDIKREVDVLLPDSLIEEDKIVMLRKFTMERVMMTEGAREKGLQLWEGIKNAVMDTSDDISFDEKEVAVDFQENRIDKLIPLYLFKGDKESFDDMTEDVAMSIMAYAGMANEYSELGNIVNVLENARYMAAERDVKQHTGIRTQIERIGRKDKDDEYHYKEPYTVKQARTNMQAALNDFFSMHIYGHVQAQEGTFGDTRIDKRKMVNLVNNIVSLSQMALNIPQRIANVNTGMTQIAVESFGKGALNAKDVAWAINEYRKHTADRLAQTGRTDYDDKLSLWLEHFDVHQDNGRDAKSTRYSKKNISRWFNSNMLYAGLTMGEDFLSAITALCVARNFKVVDKNNKEANLWDAYEVKYLDDANKTGAYLALKDGYRKADKTDITTEDEIKYQKKVIGLNFEMQGIYNLDDRSAVQQYAFGALIIMYRKWIAPAIKRRYQGMFSGQAGYSLLKGEYEEGYYTTMFRLIKDSVKDGITQVSEEEGTKACLNLISDIKAVIECWKINYDKLTDYEKSNISRAMSELSIVLGLFGASFALSKLPPVDDDKKLLKWTDQVLVSQILRLKSEISAQAPTPSMLKEFMRILDSPFAAIGPIRDGLKIFQLMVPSNYVDTVQTGPYKGRSKAYKYFRELPLISMFKKIDNFIDPSTTIQYYETLAYN